ncbi:MAG TPA: pantoate--beta-alanine ligase [Nevskiaceae bacterium]|nr:pantoate--beta-alanine ligase [Nevskiaceae bacterium]
MQTCHGIAELRASIRAWKGTGQKVAFVPTMGNLHRGHIELVRKARELAPRVVASVFVNPLQFGPNEDFDRYPRTLPEDQRQLAEAKCDAVFAPSVREMYPDGAQNLTRVSVPGLSSILDGEFRPGHFDGVATVVNLLLNIVQPDLALFGEKDYQQLQVIRRMVADLQLPVGIVGVATQRDIDGLALSSRNQYLSATERIVAPELYRTLLETANALRKGVRDFVFLEGGAVKRLQGAGFEPQYVAIRTKTLEIPATDTKEFVVLAAAQLGSTRLIDNLQVDAV